MKFLKTARKYGTAVLTSTGALVGSAHAAVPAAISTAIGDMQADGVTVATSCVVALFAVFTIKFLWRSKA